MDNQEQYEQFNQDTTITTSEPNMPIAPVPQYQPPTHATPLAQPYKSNKPLIIVLIILTVSMLLFIIGAFIANPYLVKIRESVADKAESDSDSSYDTTTTSYGTTDNSPNNYQPVPDDRQAAEKAVNDYFALLNAGKFIEAVDSMSYNTIKDSTIRQQWISSFSNLSSIIIETLEEINPDMWVNSTPQYHIFFKATFEPSRPNNSIFEEGDNSRYVFVINEDGVKKVHSLQTTTNTIF